MRKARVGAALAVVLVLTACSGGDAPAAESAAASAPGSVPTTALTPSASATTASPPTSTAPSVGVATPDASSSSSAPAVPLTGYGATLAVWATHHDPDERFDPGAMWDPTRGWGPDEANNDKFNDVVVTGDRVLRYDMYLPRPSVAAATAISLATASLPSDAVVLWRRQFAACYAVQLSSVSLGKVLARAPFSNPQGQVQLQLRSATPTTATRTFDPAAVTSVLVRPTIATTPADFTGC